MFEIIAMNGRIYEYKNNISTIVFQKLLEKEKWINCECGSRLNTDHITSFRKAEMSFDQIFSYPNRVWFTLGNEKYASDILQ